MIVDFQQDPSGPFGTGNFRDDKGRVMYLHDPDTAQEFVKTMPGSGGGLASQVASESTDIATREMGGTPDAGPDLRLAEHRPPEPEYYDPNEAGREQAATMDAPPTNAGAELIAQLDQVTAPGSDAAGAAPATPGATPGAPPAAAEAAPGGAPPADNPGVALATQGAEWQQRIHQRSQPRDIELPKAYSPGNIALSGVKESDSATVQEGRPVDNAVEQLADEAPEVQGQIDLLRKNAGERDAAVDRAYKAQIAGASLGYGQAEDRAFRAMAERREAERQMQVVQQAIKDNDTNIHPDRVIERMSTGKRIGMILLAALNGAFGAMIGKKDNDVLNALNDAVNRDIDRQKLEVANRKASLSNDYKRFLDMGLDAKTAEGLARDKMEAAMLQFQQLTAQRANAQGENVRKAEELIAPLKIAWSQRRGDIMKETEAKVVRTREASQAHEVPRDALNPAALLAMFNLKKEQVEQANADTVGAALGHPVTADEASKIKQDTQEFATKHGTNELTRGNIVTLAEAMGLKVVRDRSGKVIDFTGDPDPGVRPLGITGNDQAARIDRMWSQLSESKVMSMAREPAARLQEQYGHAIERPFFDDRIVPMLRDLLGTIDRADANLRKGYGEAATFWDRTPSSGGRAQAAPGAAPPVRAGGATTPAQRAAAQREQQKTQRMMNEPAGGMRVEE